MTRNSLISKGFYPSGLILAKIREGQHREHDETVGSELKAPGTGRVLDGGAPGRGSHC